MLRNRFSFELVLPSSASLFKILAFVDASFFTKPKPSFSDSFLKILLMSSLGDEKLDGLVSVSSTDLMIRISWHDATKNDAHSIMSLN